MSLSAEAYLKQIEELDLAINQEIERIADLKLAATSSGAIDYSKDRVQTSPVNALERQIINYVDLEDRLNQRIDRFVDAKEKVIAQIRELHNPMYIQILFKVYVQYKSLKQTAGEMGKAYQTILTNHEKALTAFEEVHENLQYFSGE